MYTSLRLSALLFLLPSLLAACTSSTTSVTAPTGNKCQVAASNSPGSFTASGGSGTVTITAARDCTWSMSADSPWISVQGPTSGQGGASVAFSVQPNPVPEARSGSIVVSSDRLAVSQAGAPCRFTISRTADATGAGGGRLSIEVSTLSGCAWTASSNVSWISILAGQSGSASGTVVLAIAANDGAERVGSVNVAGQIYTVTQAAKPVAPTPAPSPSPAPTPSPSPTPPPPSTTPTTITFAGSVSGVAGKCPAVTFVVAGLVVATSDATSYSHGDCGDVRDKAQLSGSGVTQPNGSILATSIAFKD